MEQTNDRIIRVGILHEQAVVRAGLRALLAGDARIAVRWAATELDAVWPLVEREGSVRVLLLELSLPVQRSLGQLRALAERLPGVGVVAVGGELTVPVATQAVQSGAQAVFCKRMEGPELVNAVRCVAEGGLYANPWMLKQVRRKTPVPDEPTDLLALLSPREEQVMRRMCHPQGGTWQDIAEHLRIGVRTVQTHRDGIYRKWKVQRRSEVVRLAMLHHYI